MRLRSRHTLATFVGLASAMVVNQALADSTATKNTATASWSLEEVIVTAKKRSESINDVGMSINALTGDALQDNHVVNLEDLSLAVPGLSYANSANNSPIYSLRGVGLQDATLGVYPAVSLYMDEVPLPFPVMTSLTGYDLERVEVLKGPQGILFGQNSTGGAINFVAKKPTDTFEMGTELTHSRFNTLLADAYISGPLTDTLNARASLRTQNGDDWQKSKTHNGEAGAPETYAGRLLFDWQPTDNLSALLNLNMWTDKSTPQELQFVAWRALNPVSSPAENATPAKEDAREVDFSPETNHFRDNHFEQVGLRVDYTFAEEFTLTAISSYIEFERREAFDLDGLAYRALDTSLTKGDVTSFSQELRLANDSDNAFRWLVGINYSTDTADEDTAIIYPDATIAVATGGLVDRGGYISNQDMENKALFTSVEQDIFDTLTLKAGLRYTEAKRDLETCTYDIDNHLSVFFGGQVGISIPEGECVSFNNSFQPVLHTDQLNEDNTSWQIGLDWTPDNDALYYVNIAKGYKAGSYPALAAASTNQYVPATQESLLDYEAGAKLTLLDGLMAANFAVFYYDYTDKQLRTTLDDPIFGYLDVLGNIPESSVKGFEADITSRPLNGLTITAEFTYLDAKIDKFVGLNSNGVLLDYSGTDMPLTPKRQASLGANYEFDVGDGLIAKLGANVVYRSKTNATLGSIDEYTLPDYTLVNANASIGSVNDAWRVQIWGKNLFDEYYRTNVFSFQDVITASAGQAPTYGITLTLRY